MNKKIVIGLSLIGVASAVALMILSKDDSLADGIQSIVKRTFNPTPLVSPVPVTVPQGVTYSQTVNIADRVPTLLPVVPQAGWESSSWTQIFG